MPIYNDEISMMEDSLKESLVATKWCIDYEKSNNDWQTKGCLGFPAAILLLSIADAIGSYFRGNKQFGIKINGEREAIKLNSQHFYILNSDYCGLNLDKDIIDQIHRDYRNKIVHNFLLPLNHFLDIGNESDIPFVVEDDKEGKKYPIKINLLSFYKISEKAVKKFIGCTFTSEGKMIEELRHKRKTPKNKTNITHASTGSTEYISTQLIKEQQDDDKK